jgi:glycine/serine hydroxymethyltransferase
MNIEIIDPDIATLIQYEEERQSSTLGLIPSESYASPAVTTSYRYSPPFTQRR